MKITQILLMVTLLAFFLVGVSCDSWDGQAQMPSGHVLEIDGNTKITIVSINLLLNNSSGDSILINYRSNCKIENLQGLQLESENVSKRFELFAENLQIKKIEFNVRTQNENDKIWIAYYNKVNGEWQHRFTEGSVTKIGL